MKDNSDANTAPSGKRQEPEDEYSRKDARYSMNNPRAAHSTNGHAPANPFNFWVIMDLLAQRWHWLVLGASFCAAAFFVLGWDFIKPRFTAQAQFIRVEPPGMSELFKTTPLSGETLSALLRSPELLTRVGRTADPQIPMEKLSKSMKVDPEADSDIIKVLLAAASPQQAVELMNSYTREAIEYTKQL